MGSVDFLDSLIALYMIRIRSRKMVAQILYHFNHMFMAQCWLRYNKYASQMGVDHVPLQDFTMNLVLTLCI